MGLGMRVGRACKLWVLGDKLVYTPSQVGIGQHLHNGHQLRIRNRYLRKLRSGYDRQGGLLCMSRRFCRNHGLRYERRRLCGNHPQLRHRIHKHISGVPKIDNLMFEPFREKKTSWNCLKV